MGIPVQPIFIGVIIVLLVYAIGGANGEDQIKCTGTTFYKVKKNGQAGCKECPPCKGGGIGWNITEKRIEDEHGFRSCYNCVICQPGTYRELGSRYSECEPCSLDCKSKNRYGSVRCGGATPGHCGDCLTGYHSNSKEVNSMCTRRVTEAVDVFTSSKPTTTRTWSEEGDKDHSPIANVPIWIPGGILLFLTMVVIAVAIYSAKCQKRTKKNKQDAPKGSDKLADSRRGLLSSGSSIGVDNDIDTDGVPTAHVSKVRGELPTVVTIDEIEAMGFRPKPYEELNFNDRVLTKDDKTLTIVAQNVYGEQRYELFQTYLKIEKSKTSPEEEKWRNDITSFPDYIFEVLKIWLQNADKAATLKALCKALEMASFDDVIEKVLNLPENQPVFKTKL